ncbi:MAG: hypothetical protein WBF93_13855 [Pirellulales bacterium]
MSVDLMPRPGVIVYRLGNLTADNFTPRLDKDTVARPGQEPGLSASETIPLGRKAQAVDLSLLLRPLRAFPDDPEQGGTPGHVAIAPANPSDEVVMDALNAWALFRGSEQTHPYTQILLDAVVKPNMRKDP